ncbi:MAG: hypothetical protein ACK5E6_08610 [Cyanobacteriota bacterium]|jgi:hypothetical protein
MLRPILSLWLVALAASALLVAAGARWPDPLPVQLPVVALLVLLPPGLVAGWLLARWQP